VATKLTPQHKRTTKRVGNAVVATTRNKQQQGVSRHNATKQRLQNSSKTWLQRKGYAMGKPPPPRVGKPPLPKLPPLPKTSYKLGNLNKVVVAYAQQIWHMQSNSYVNTQCTITAYVITTYANNTALCIVPKNGTRPTYYITAHTHPHGFNSGLQQFTIIQWLT
jgi:hypothetical protein